MKIYVIQREQPNMWSGAKTDVLHQAFTTIDKAKEFIYEFIERLYWAESSLEVSECGNRIYAGRDCFTILDVSLK